MQITAGEGIIRTGKQGIVASMLWDPSALSLLASNIIVMFFALTQGWSLITLMLVYWCQSVIIGLFNFLKMITMKNWESGELRINGRKADSSEGTKWFVAIFFAFHYGLFHLVYLFFIGMGALFTIAGPATGITQGTGAPDFLYVLLSAPLFFANHLFSFLHNKERDSARKQNLGKMMFFPYARIVPMHITIVIGGAFLANQAALFMFLALKTIADIAMHVSEHRE